MFPKPLEAFFGFFFPFLTIWYAVNLSSSRRKFTKIFIVRVLPEGFFFIKS